MKCLCNLDAVLQTIYKLLLMELQVGYFVVYVSNKVIILFIF